jgi:hypothetical protein
MGRFVLLNANGGSKSGAPLVLRMDTATGATWAVSREPTRWIGVEDELQRAGTYNRETKKIEWGVKAPDGRDLNELSKEELIWYLAAAIRNGSKPDLKNDPMGLFPEKTKQSTGMDTKRKELLQVADPLEAEIR